MSFDHPAGLLLLGSLGVILWLHLRRRWPRPHQVPSLTPWVVLLSKSPPRRHRLPRNLLLLMHLAAATLIALAAAGPRIATGRMAASNVALVIDVSTSMSAADRWEEATAEAEAVIGSTHGELTLVTLGPRPQVIVGRDAEGHRALAALRGLSPGGSGARTYEALTLAAAAAGPEAGLVVVTDGAIPTPSADAPQAQWIEVGEGESNVAIVDAAGRVAGGVTRLFARIASFGKEPCDALVELSVDEVPYDRAEVTLVPDEAVEFVWTLPSDAQLATLTLKPTDALAADNTVRIPLSSGQRQVQFVGDLDSAVGRAVAAVPQMEVQVASLKTIRTDGSFDVSVFYREAPNELPPGGVLIIDPPASELLHVSDGGSAGDVVAMGSHPIFAGVDLTGVMLEGLSNPACPSWAAPVLSAGGKSAVLAGSLDGSRVVVFAFDPSRGVIAERLAFPVLMAQAMEWVAPAYPSAVYRAGEIVPLPPGRYVVERPRGGAEPTGHQFAGTGDEGLYKALLDVPGSGRALQFGVLAGDAVESDLRKGPGGLPRLDQPSGTLEGGRSLWPQLAALALLIVLAEGLVASNAGRERTRERSNR